MASQTNDPVSASSSTWAGASNIPKSAANQQFALSGTAGTASNDLSVGFGPYLVEDSSTGISLSVPGAIEAMQRSPSADTVNIYVSTDGSTKTWGPFGALSWPSGNGVSTLDAAVTPPALLATGLTPLQCRSGLYLIVELPTTATGAVGLDFLSLEATWTPPSGAYAPPVEKTGRIMFGVREL